MIAGKNSFGESMKQTIVNSFGRLWNKLDVPRLNPVRFNILVGVYKMLPFIGGVNYPRLVEWQFVLKKLPNPPAKVIDIGSTTSLFPYKLNSTGYKTFCLDQRSPKSPFPKSIIFYQGNIMDLQIEENSFDGISCISVIEHVGMGKYGDPKSPKGGDTIAVEQMLRILKPGGRLIITTNICRNTCELDGEVRYGSKRLKELMSLGKFLEVEYRYFDGRRWLVCDEAFAFDRDANNFGIAMFVLSK